MSVHGKYETVSIVTANNLESMLHKVVAADGDVAQTNIDALGVLVSRPDSGQHMAIAYQGHVKAYAGAAITKGNPLKVTTSGYLIAVTSGNLVVPCGRAVTTAASGDVFEAIVNFANAGVNV